MVITVENLYWILYANLLEPCGIDCHYYYPFGTQQNLSGGGEFKPVMPQREHNVLFHYDQEPIWTDHFGKYDNHRCSWSQKLVRILANSEHSALKKKICNDRKMLDWYYFYHGLAALHWYQDAEHIEQDHAVKNAFVSFNHVFQNRSYRAALLARLVDQETIHNASISFHVELEDIDRELLDPYTRLSAQSIAVIQKHRRSLDSLPWSLDDVPVDGDLSARFGHQEYQLWQHSLWHLVTETVFYEPKLHLTEKTFKPIVAGRPFILVAAPGNLQYLRSYGFKTFDRWIDESYDQMHDPDQRLDAIVSQIKKFADMTVDELRSVHQDMLPVLHHNKQHFFGKFREIIVAELVDNFDQCIRIWNNGRVDGRDLPLHPDLEGVKRLLLR